MELIGTIPTPQMEDEDDVNLAEMKRLKLDKQYKRFAVGHKREDGQDYPILLFGDGTLMLNFHREGCVMLSGAEVCQLYTFFEMTHVKELMINILRANMIEAGHGDLIDQLMAMPDEVKQAVL